MLLRIYAPTKYTLPETPKKNGNVKLELKLMHARKYEVLSF